MKYSKQLIRYCSLLLGLFLALAARAASPSWTCIPENFEQSMIVTGKMYIHEQVVRKTTCVVGAFINGECRGSASLVYYPSLDAYIASLIIYGHNTDENKDLTFRCYEQDADSIYSLIDTLKYSSNGIIGHFADPFQWGLMVKTSLSTIKMDVLPAFVGYSSWKGTLNIHFDSPLLEDAQITIYAMNGMEVRKVFCKKGSSIADVTTLQSGLYMLKLSGETIQKSIKVMVL